jgi:transcriptional regulator with XRE-family HTH domain
MNGSYSDTPQPVGLAHQLGMRLKLMRETLDLSQRKFAAHLGISPSYLSAVERGDDKPNADIILAAAASLPQVNMDWLLTGVGKMLATAAPDGEAADFTKSAPTPMPGANTTPLPPGTYDLCNEATAKIHSAGLMLVAIERLNMDGMEMMGEAGPAAQKLFEVLHQLTEVTATFVREALNVTSAITVAVSGAHQR